MSIPAPLPVRDGVNATRLKVPETGPWPTVHDYVLETFGHIDPAGITQRFQDGEVVDAAGRPVSTSTPLGTVDFLWYYRSLPEETPLPVTEEVLYEDEHLLAVDKPHFLPTTPAGKYVQESLLVRLRNRLDLPDLIPIHRLDRGTAGVVLFSKQPDTRGAYQVLFEHRRVAKQYECISAWTDGTDIAGRFPLTVRNRIEKTKGVVVSELKPYGVAHSGVKPHERRPAKGRRRTEVVPGPNAESRVELLKTGVNRRGLDVGLFRLTPHTGKTHQLRIHMALLGLGIMHDRFYPELAPDTPDDFDAPLQLLAREIAFTDPITRAPRRFVSNRRLIESPTDTTSQGPGHGIPQQHAQQNRGPDGRAAH
ncbi:pseudouridine synthase [Nesterenkonia flava]|uniref:RNA pseudouridylate synthase n=1 Tax=Nesterenkonia flava TaxID=469799 RepID=A0ABU1FQX6_9MICC|nr:pseudouridine synthase [Nesterenkonia flava]MDR5711019.1 pseudouridine synthase [Nesterenkonia flava]